MRSAHILKPSSNTGQRCGSESGRTAAQRRMPGLRRAIDTALMQSEQAVERLALRTHG
jgi:hypothetical protein